MKPRVLFIDDDKLLLKAISRQFRNDFELITDSDPTNVESIILENEEFSVIVSDMLMPGRKGSEVLRLSKELSPNSTRLLLTGESDFQDSVDAVNQGQIFRFLTKPCDGKFLKAAILDGVKQYELINVEKTLLEKTLKGAILMMSNMISLIRPDLFSHCLNLRTHALNIAKGLKIQETWEIEVACLLSHIGCLTLDQNLVKRKLRGDELSQEELSEFNSHLEIGAKMIRQIPRMEKVAQALLDMESTSLELTTDLPSISHILKVVQDYEIQNKIYQSKKKTIALLKNQPSTYVNHLFDFIESSHVDDDTYYESRTISIKDIGVGMLISEDLYKNNVLLLSKNQEITETMKICIRKLYEGKQLEGDIKVLIKRKTDPST